MDPPRGVPLLARRGPVGLKPPIDHRPIPTELRGRATHRRPLRRRHRRRQRLLHRPAMNPMPHRQPANREALPITIPSDLLELLHPGSHSLWRLPLELDEPRTVSRPSDTRWSQFKPSQWSHFRASLPRSRRVQRIRGNRPGSCPVYGLGFAWIVTAWYPSVRACESVEPRPGPSLGRSVESLNKSPSLPVVGVLRTRFAAFAAPKLFDSSHNSRCRPRSIPAQIARGPPKLWARLDAAAGGARTRS